MVGHMLLTGLVPWEGDTRGEIQASIDRELSDTAGFHSFLTWMATSSQCSLEGASFITGLLTPEPDMRLTCVSARAHPWLSTDSASSVPKRSLSTRRRERTSHLQMVKKLKDFRNHDQLKRTVLLAMSFGVASAEMVELGEKFKGLDTDHDGLIGWEEFNAAMMSFGSTNTDENREIFEAINQDGTGKIKYSEFVASQLERDVTDANVHLEAAFHRLDLNDDGKIGMEELLVLLQGPDSDEAEAREEALCTLKELGKEADGEIDMDEFKTAMRGVFSPEVTETGGEETQDAAIGQFKMMQLRLANQLRFRQPVPTSEAVNEASTVVKPDKIGQFKLRQLMLASRLQFKEAPPSSATVVKPTTGQFKLRRLMLANQLQALKRPLSKEEQGSKSQISKLTAPGSFRRRLDIAQNFQTKGDDGVDESKMRRRGTAKQ